MRFTITAAPRLDFTLAAADLDMLLDLSRCHYDQRCKAFGRPGAGSTLHGWNMQREDGAESVDVRATIRDLDTCLKILEMAGYVEAHAARGAVLSRRLLCAARDAQLVAEGWSHVTTIA